MATTKPQEPFDQLSEVRAAVEAVLKTGLRPSRLVRAPEVLASLAHLRLIPRTSEAARLAFATEATFERATAGLGAGPYGQATRLLFGIDDESLGLPLKTRRRLAAEELGVYPSTFRKLYEPGLLDDVAFELLRAAHRRTKPKTE